MRNRTAILQPRDPGSYLLSPGSYTPGAYSTVHRKGLIVAPSPAPGGHLGAYGAWRPRKKRLAACDEMQGWYEKYMENERRKAEQCGGRRWGKCARKYRKRGRTYRKRGKSAWRICKKEGRLSEAREIQAGEDMSLTLPFAPMEGPPSFAVAQAGPYAPDPYAPGLYQDPGVVGVPEETNWLMWGGLAAGAAVLGWWALRK
jgi:hypothetical protein